jgi:hypothetical protein
VRPECLSRDAAAGTEIVDLVSAIGVRTQPGRGRDPTPLAVVDRWRAGEEPEQCGFAVVGGASRPATSLAIEATTTTEPPPRSINAGSAS